MPTRIEMLKQAGFSDAEISDWATAERRRMHDAGFTDDEIDEEFGVTRPPKEVPAAFIERLKQGNALQRIAGAAGDYAQHYFGDEPLGFSEKNMEALHRLGVVGDIVVPVAKPVDAALRSVPAGLAAVGAGIGQAVEEAENAAFGSGPEAKGKAARDFAQLAQIAGLLSGASRTAPLRARVPASGSASVTAIVLPRAEDFRNAAAVISGSPASFRVEQKLLRLWADHGIPPAEAARDAMRNRAIAEDLRSDSGKLPEAYVGTSPEKAGATGIGSDAPAASVAPAAAGHAGATAESRPVAMTPQTSAALAEAAPEPVPMTAQSRAINLFEPPPAWQRPFKWDYRTPPLTMGDGQLLRDIEGRPLVARYIAGRRFADRPDRRLSYDDIRAALPHLDIRLVEAPALPEEDPKVVGLYQGVTSEEGPEGDIYVKSTMSPEDRNLTLAHEFSHAIDHFAGTLSKKLKEEHVDELRKVYTTLRAGPRKTPHPQPEDFGYGKRSVKSELMAEGIRAYLTNPNYFKATAPRTAALIRNAVNSNPYLRHIIQFNSLAAAGLIGEGVAGQDQDSQKNRPRSPD